MKIIVDGRHVRITDAMRDYALEKAKKFSRFFDGIQSIHITLSVEKRMGTTEVVITASRGKTMICHTQSRDIYSSLDLAETNMKRQLRKHKEKLKSHRKRNKTKGSSEG